MSLIRSDTLLELRGPGFYSSSWPWSSYEDQANGLNKGSTKYHRNHKCISVLLSLTEEKILFFVLTKTFVCDRIYHFRVDPTLFILPQILLNEALHSPPNPIQWYCFSATLGIRKINVLTNRIPTQNAVKQGWSTAHLPFSHIWIK